MVYVGVRGCNLFKLIHLQDKEFQDKLWTITPDYINYKVIINIETLKPLIEEIVEVNLSTKLNVRTHFQMLTKFDQSANCFLFFHYNKLNKWNLGNIAKYVQMRDKKYREDIKSLYTMQSNQKKSITSTTKHIKKTQ